MKKPIFLGLLISMILLTSCMSEGFQAPKDLVSPENIKSPLRGKWVVRQVYELTTSEKADPQVEYNALFHKDAILIGTDYIQNPQYKYRKLKLEDYLLFMYKLSLDELGLENKDVDVITITSNNQFFQELVKYEEDHFFYYDNDKFYFLQQTSTEVSKEEIDRYIQIEESILRIGSSSLNTTNSSGLLLGIKSYEYDSDKDLDHWKYKTIWIKGVNDNIVSIYEIDNLLVPRKKGFWTVYVNRYTRDGIYDEVTSIENRLLNKEITNEEDNSLIKVILGRAANESKSPILKNIQYIGNDYLSLELVDMASGRKELRTYPIDYLSEDKPSMISDIMGQEGENALMEGAQSLGNIGTGVIDNESFGLNRRNGYWILKGRMNYTEKNQEYYKDYNIKYIPPKDMVAYDDLLVPWNTIKSQIPDALDAFTSPNDDIIIVVTRNNLFIYSLIDFETKPKEIGRIKLAATDSVVMAEWALGRYVDLWEEEVLKKEPTNLKR